MNRLHVLELAIAIVVTFSTGCKNDGVSVDDRPVGLYAKVVDAGGGVVAGVNVHYIFYTSTNAVVLNASIQYSLPTPQVVTLKVFDPFDRELTTLINAQQQPAGSYMRFFDSSVTNGMYSFRLQANDSLLTVPFYIRDDDTARLQMKPPLITSDQSGAFFLSPSVLGIGRKFQGQFYAETIFDSISVVLVKANYKTLVQGFGLDTTTPIDKIFTLEPN